MGVSPILGRPPRDLSRPRGGCRDGGGIQAPATRGGREPSIADAPPRVFPIDVIVIQDEDEEYLPPVRGVHLSWGGGRRRSGGCPRTTRSGREGGEERIKASVVRSHSRSFACFAGKNAGERANEKQRSGQMDTDFRKAERFLAAKRKGILPAKAEGLAPVAGVFRVAELHKVTLCYTFRESAGFLK